MTDQDQTKTDEWDFMLNEVVARRKFKIEIKDGDISFIFGICKSLRILENEK